MKDLLSYCMMGLLLLFTVGQFAAHVPMRYHRGGVARPYTFWERLREACEGWWIPLVMCGLLYALAIPFAFVYGIWKHEPAGFVMEAYTNNWKLLLGLAAACVIQEIGKGLDLTAQDSESFKEHTMRRLAAIEKKLWSRDRIHEQDTGRIRGLSGEARAPRRTSLRTNTRAREASHRNTETTGVSSVLPTNRTLVNARALQVYQSGPHVARTFRDRLILPISCDVCLSNGRDPLPSQLRSELRPR